MSERREIRDDDRLRTLLRRGDPAGSKPEGLAGPALARMRARVVGAAADRPRLTLGTFAWATGAAAALLLVVAIALRPEGPAPSSSGRFPEEPRAVNAPASPPPEAASEPAAASIVPLAAAAPGDAPEGAGGEPSPKPVTGSRSPRVASVAWPPGVGALDASTTALGSARKPLTVQFTTPAGTRIIWTLDPEFKG